ncbi:MAG: beta-N-acetylhexosaminidase [Bacteroidetes bacterium]|nr:beta-N-acetylhexosaminidase [Bacteroidota bacterium]
MKAIFLVLTLSLFSVVHAQQKSIIPKPVKAEWLKGNFKLSPTTVLVASSADEKKSADFFNGYLQTFYGLALKIEKNKPASNYILFSASKPSSLSDEDERYVLNVSEQAIQVTGNAPEGVFRGVQTLIQLLPVEKLATITIPAVAVEDFPRFKYRGMMLDCGRHFFSTDFVKKYIDFIALHKMNTFHWHLTEDQGWRIEIKKYPRLTEIGGCRNGTIIGHHPGTGNDNEKYCGYYTQEEIKEIVKYAKDRFINIIPEIEMPGHASAAIAAYPQLSCFPNENTPIAKGVQWSGDSTGKQVQQSWGVYPDVFCPSDYTFNFLEDVLDEVMQLFPSKYIHIGGDECPKEYWKRSAFCQNLIKEKGLKNEEGLQSYFIHRIEKYLNSKGRNIIGWDEILEGGIAPNATIMSWRGEQGGIEAAHQDHDVVMTPGGYLYLDHAQSKKEDSLTIGGYLPVETVYSYNPIPAELPADKQKYILGAQANVWTEYMSNPAKVEYMIFPRMSAVSEVLWSRLEDKNFDDFLRRLQTQYKRYDLWKVKYNLKGTHKGE